MQGNQFTQASAEICLAFSLPSYLLKEDPSTNLILAIDCNNESETNQAVFKVDVNGNQMGKSFFVCKQGLVPGLLSSFVKTIPWKNLHLSDATNGAS